MTLHAIPTAMGTLRSGGASVTFHVGSDMAGEALTLHKLQGKQVELHIFENPI